jgi:cytoskeletal protein RodZ
MTTRHEPRRATQADRPELPGSTSRDPWDPRETRPGDAPLSLPERLYAAREAKGVDLYRAERDTKIRARYLGALERGDYKELPGAVYTKGFLRNYALYLNLDPDEILEQWRRERGNPREAPQAPVAPRPLAAPRKGLTFSPFIIVLALMTVGVLIFVAYLGVQLLRFAKPPTISVTQPSTAVVEVDGAATSYTMRGVTLAGATVNIASPGRDPYSVTADSTGSWRADVDLRRGRNQFDVSALDPDTGKHSEENVLIYITVPFLEIEAPTLVLDQPAEAASYSNGAIPVQGRTTNADSVVLTAAYMGPAGDTSTGSKATPAPPAVPKPETVPVGDDGTFSASYELTAGKWAITVTASSPEGTTTAITRNVTVAFKGVNVVVEIKSGRAWLKVWVDGQVSEETTAAGRVYAPGKVLTFRAKESVEVRTGKSSATYFTVNGIDVGRMNDVGQPETWLFAPPDEPVRTDRR